MSSLARPEERVLDRVKFHPETNRAYGFAAVAPPTVAGITYKYWYPGPIFDQGREGACVAFGDTQELASSPIRVKGLTNAWASALYQEVRAMDRSMGNNWDSGASTLAGMKVLQAKGYISEYRWAFSMDEIKAALLTEGPVVIGIRWLDGMYYTDPNGRVRVSGNVVGGHQIVLNGWAQKRKLAGETSYHEYYRWVNSWGTDYGVNGQGFIRAEDLADLMSDGEAAVPMGRKLIGT